MADVENRDEWPRDVLNIDDPKLIKELEKVIEWQVVWLINLSSYQSAIYEELVKLGYEVYDEVTENANFPYIVIGDVWRAFGWIPALLTYAALFIFLGAPLMWLVARLVNIGNNNNK